MKNALGNLEVNRDVADAIEIDRAISENCGFLKGIMVLNDMKFLDKRRPLGDQIESYKRYYNGILNDIKHFLET